MPHSIDEREVPVKGAPAAIAATIILALALSCAGPPGEVTGSPSAVRVGTRVPPLCFTDLDGAQYSLPGLFGPGSASGAPVVLAWTGAGCPMAQVYAPRLAALARDYAPRGVRFFQIHSSVQDTPDDIRAEARKRPVGFPVVHDADGRLARALGVQRTTEVLVVDGHGTLRYRGAVDDQYGFRGLEDGARTSFRRSQPGKHYLREALDAVLGGREVARPTTEAFGCALGLPPVRDGSRGTRDMAPGGVTFHEDVEPLLQEHCQECHRPGGIAPFSLVEYRDVKGWSRTLREVVTDRLMPPWYADPKYGTFRNDRSLPPQAVATFQQWVDAGAPRGDPKAAPPRRTWPGGWTIGEPDIVFQTPPFTVPGEDRVPYRYVSIDTAFEEDRWVQAAQFRSTSPEVVHHVLTLVQDIGTAKRPGDRPWRPVFNPLRLLEGARPSEYGQWIRRNRENMKHMAVGNGGGLDGYFVGALAGDTPEVYPEGRAKLLPAGARLVFQIHYTPDGREHESVTSLALRFAPRRPAEALETHAATTIVFAIPPGDPAYEVEASYTFPRAATLFALGPHMHLRGKSCRFEAEYPDGSTETLLHVPNYDFDWQVAYVLEIPKRIPQGTILRVTGTFDNSPANPDNPDPEKEVYFGLQSDEEMMIGYFEVVWDQEEDRRSGSAEARS